MIHYVTVVIVIRSTLRLSKRKLKQKTAISAKQYSVVNVDFPANSKP